MAISGSRAFPQDRFLVMAAEMKTGVAADNQDLAKFWKEIPKAKVMEHRLGCFHPSMPWIHQVHSLIAVMIAS